jgi:hypothetical protein
VQVGGSALIGSVFGAWCTSHFTDSRLILAGVAVAFYLLFGWVGYRYGLSIFRAADWSDWPRH